MSSITTSTAANGLPVQRIDIPGTHALTVLVAFDAGARTERAEENGIAHFLEHLVFKGGEKYADPQKINTSAERIGAVLNAYTSHDIVAFHLTCRAEVANAGIDLLTDFVGRPLLAAPELERERGVVIQEIARANDQPAVVAEHLIDRATFGDHPLGRPVLGTKENISKFSADDVRQFRQRQWTQEPAGAFLIGNLAQVPDDEHLLELFARFPAVAKSAAAAPPASFSSAAMVDERDSHQSHLRLAHRVAIDPNDRAQQSALAIFSTVLGGSMGSRLFNEIREQRGLAYSVYAVDSVFSDGALLQLSAGLDSEKCIEAFERMCAILAELRDDGPSDEEFERARAYTAGRLVLAFENSNAVARYAARQAIVLGMDIDPDAAVRAIDATTKAQVIEVGQRVSDSFALACVGPHKVEEFGIAVPGES